MPLGPRHHRENPIEAPGTPLGRHMPGPALAGLVSAFCILPTSDVSPHGTGPGAQRLRGVRKETPPTRILSLAANLQRRVVICHPSARDRGAAATWSTLPAPASAGSADTRPWPVLGGERAASAEHSSGSVRALPAEGAFPEMTSPQRAWLPAHLPSGLASQHICRELGAQVSPPDSLRERNFVRPHFTDEAMRPPEESAARPQTRNEVCAAPI